MAKEEEQVRRRRPGRGRSPLGLALGGGAARGLAHIGVLKVLEEKGIRVGTIAGTSMGAITGGKYAVNPDARLLEEEILEFLQSDLFKRAHLDFLDAGDGEPHGFFFHLARYVSRRVYYTLAANQRSMIKDSTFWEMMETLIADTPIESTTIPFAATAVDLKSGLEVVLKGGSLRQAVAASCALPGMVSPVEMEEYELIDGGWLDLVPCALARDLGARMVVGVWVGSDLEESGGWDSSIDILSRADDITRHHLGVSRLQECDVMINPQVGHYSWAEFDKAEEIIAAGEEAARQALPRLKRALAKARLTRFLPRQRNPKPVRIPLFTYTGSN